MKTTVTESSFREAFKRMGRADQFSHEALGALFEYLSEMDRESGTEMELDVVAICCDFCEYASALEAAEAYDFEPTEKSDERADQSEKEALVYLSDNTQVIELPSGGVVIANS